MRQLVVSALQKFDHVGAQTRLVAGKQAVGRALILDQSGRVRFKLSAPVKTGKELDG